MDEIEPVVYATKEELDSLRMWLSNNSNKLEAMEKSLDAIKKKVGGMKSKLSAAVQRLDIFEPHAVEGMLDKMQNRASDVKELISIMVTRGCVATEIAFAARHAEPAVGEFLNRLAIYSLDLPNTFFDRPDREQLTIKAWIGLVRDDMDGRPPNPLANAA